MPPPLASTIIAKGELSDRGPGGEDDSCWRSLLLGPLAVVGIGGNEESRPPTVGWGPLSPPRCSLGVDISVGCSSNEGVALRPPPPPIPPKLFENGWLVPLLLLK